MCFKAKKSRKQGFVLAKIILASQKQLIHVNIQSLIQNAYPNIFFLKAVVVIYVFCFKTKLNTLQSCHLCCYVSTVIRLVCGSGLAWSAMPFPCQINLYFDFLANFYSFSNLAVANNFYSSNSTFILLNLWSL